MACMFYFARCLNIIFNSLLAQLVKYDAHTTRKIKLIHAIFYHISLLYTTSLRWWSKLRISLGTKRSAQRNPQFWPPTRWRGI